MLHQLSYCSTRSITHHTTHSITLLLGLSFVLLECLGNLIHIRALGHQLHPLHHIFPGQPQHLCLKLQRCYASFVVLHVILCCFEGCIIHRNLLCRCLTRCSFCVHGCPATKSTTTLVGAAATCCSGCTPHTRCRCDTPTATCPATPQPCCRCGPPLPLAPPAAGVSSTTLAAASTAVLPLT